ncbi:MAG: hypothetical protein GY796_21570 [Chloroflexi bacterium]|nr:hypothetical protein [Chloroflexota bacterium]
MSEYIEIETEMSDDGMQMHFITNLKLVEGELEVYDSAVEMEEGSAVAQALAMVEGIIRLEMNGRDMAITRNSETDWHIIVADVSAVLKDFFL